MIRRLTADELAHTDARPLVDSAPRADHARAKAVIDELLPFLQGDLNLSAAQVDDLCLALERALARTCMRERGAAS